MKQIKSVQILNVRKVYVGFRLLFGLMLVADLLPQAQAQVASSEQLSWNFDKGAEGWKWGKEAGIRNGALYMHNAKIRDMWYSSPGIQLRAGQTYRLSFKARGKKNKPLNFLATFEPGIPEEHSGKAKFNLKPTNQPFSHEFTVPRDGTYHLTFFTSNIWPLIFIDKVTLTGNIDDSSVATRTPENQPEKVSNPSVGVSGPSDASSFYGNPIRGAEPDQKPDWIPELKPIGTNQVNQGNPLTDTGHFRLKKEVIGVPWGTMPYIVSLTEDQADRAAARYRNFKWKNGSDLKYSVLEPDSALKPRGGFPLVVIIPGSGAIGRDSVSGRTRNVDPEIFWATEYYRKNLPAVVLVMHPQARTHSFEDGPDGTTFMRPSPVLDAMDDLIIEMAKRDDVNSQRVVVTGFSMGGSSTWLLIERHPFFYAAAAPIAGRPLLRPEDAEKVKPVAIWMSIGNQDPWSGSLLYVKTWQNLQEVEHPNVRFWEVQDRGHDIDIGNTLPMAKWLWEQQRPELP